MADNTDDVTIEWTLEDEGDEIVVHNDGSAECHVCTGRIPPEGGKFVEFHEHILLICGRCYCGMIRGIADA